MPYALDITVLEGTLNNVLVFDTLDPGLEIDLTSLQVVASGFAGDAVSILNATVTVNAQGYSILRFELDNSSDAGSQIVNPGDPAGDASDNDTIRITYNATVTNTLANQDGIELGNVAAVLADEVDLATGVESLTVVEPNLTVAKTTLTSPDDIQDAGDVIEYQVVVTNNGTSSAYDVSFADLAPADTTFMGAVTFVEVNASGSAFVNGGSTITGTINEIEVGGSVTITYQLVINDSYVAGDTLTNSVDVQWTSTAGDNDDERTGVDGPSPDDDNVLNNYDVQDEVEITPDARAGAIS